MASLLDFFNGTATPEQNQGLMAFAAQMLQAGGPSRTPTSFGQALGSGLTGYQKAIQEAEQQKRERAMQDMQQRLYGLKIADAESDVANQAAQRERAKSIIDFRSKYAGAGSPQPEAGAEAQAPVPYRAAQATEMPQAPQMQAGVAPAASAAPGHATRSTEADELLRYAAAARRAGFGEEAAAAYKQAMELQPKVERWEKVQVGGKVLFAPFFADGSNGQPVPLEVAEKLNEVNRGGVTDLTNPFTGETVRTLQNTASPEAVLAARTAANRLAFDQSQANKPQFVAEAGGYVSPPSASAPQGAFAAVPGFTKTADKQKVQDANDVISLLDQAKPLIEKSTSSYLGAGLDQAARLVGRSTEGSQAASQLKALEGSLVAKMPKMSGPQSDKDVLLYKQMAGQIGDPTLPAANKMAAMDTIRAINNRYLEQSGQQPKDPGQDKTISLADIAATAKATGRSTAEVTAAARAKGYTIGGK